MLKIILKTVFFCLLAIAAFVLLSLLWNFLMAFLGRVFGISESVLGYSSWLLLIVLIIMPKKYLRLKIPYTMSSEREINAPIQQVWEAIDLYPRSDYYKPTYKDIRAVEGSDTLFELHLDPALEDEGMPSATMYLERVEAKAPSYLATFHKNDENVGGLNFGSSASEFYLSETEDGTLVRYKETVSHLTFMLVLTLLIVNPAKDILGHLKSHVEGTENTSWIARHTKDIIENDGADTKAKVNTIGITACVVLTGIVFGLVFLILQFATA